MLVTKEQMWKIFFKSRLFRILVLLIVLALTVVLLQSPFQNNEDAFSFSTRVASSELGLRGGGFVQEGKRTYDGVERSFLVYTPPTLNVTNAPAPMVVYLHGGGQKMETSDWLFSYADTYGFYVLAPEGSSPMILRWLSMFTWNAGTLVSGDLSRGCCGYSVTSNIDDEGFIKDAVAFAMANAPVDPSRVYLVGASNGASMAYRVACKDNATFSGIVSLAAPGVPEECGVQKSINAPTMHVHGKLDLCVPYEPVQGISCNREAFKAYGLPIEPEILVQEGARPIYAQLQNLAGYPNCVKKQEDVSYKPKVEFQKSTCASDPAIPPVALLSVEDMGHVLPSDTQYAPAEFVGPLSTAISFKEIWMFLEKQTIE